MIFLPLSLSRPQPLSWPNADLQATGCQLAKAAALQDPFEPVAPTTTFNAPTTTTTTLHNDDDDALRPPEPPPPNGQRSRQPKWHHASDEPNLAEEFRRPATQWHHHPGQGQLGFAADLSGWRRRWQSQGPERNFKAEWSRPARLQGDAERSADQDQDDGLGGDLGGQHQFSRY